MFDLVIIDTPPVLPVPDALSLGRWVDGAVLVIRYDVSRFPLVDRARRRLISAGIPILKTVVNGVKTSRFGSGYVSGYESAYGYGDGYGERTQPAKPPDSSFDGDGNGTAIGSWPPAPPSRHRSEGRIAWSLVPGDLRLPKCLAAGAPGTRFRPSPTTSPRRGFRSAIRDRGMIGEGRDRHPPLDSVGHAARAKGARRATHEDEVCAARVGEAASTRR